MQNWKTRFKNHNFLCPTTSSILLLTLSAVIGLHTYQCACCDKREVFIKHRWAKGPNTSFSVHLMSGHCLTGKWKIIKLQCYEVEDRIVSLMSNHTNNDARPVALCSISILNSFRSGFFKALYFKESAGSSRRKNLWFSIIALTTTVFRKAYNLKRVNWLSQKYQVSATAGGRY